MDSSEIAEKANLRDKGYLPCTTPQPQHLCYPFSHPNSSEFSEGLAETLGYAV